MAQYSNTIDNKMNITDILRREYVDDKSNKFYIIQYQNNKCGFIHRIVQKNALEWIANFNKNETEVYLRDDKTLILVSIIYITENYQNASAQLQYLKTICFQLMHKEYNIQNNHWSLLQYNTDVDKVIYEIYNKNDIFFRKDNIYHNYNAYITKDNMVFQAVIIAQSYNWEEIDHQMNILKEQCLKQNLFAPREDQVNTMEMPLNLCQDDLKEEELNEEELSEEQILNDFKDLEKTMHQETALIAEAFLVVDTAKSYLKKKLEYLHTINKENNLNNS